MKAFLSDSGKLLRTLPLETIFGISQWSTGEPLIGIDFFFKFYSVPLYKLTEQMLNALASWSTEVINNSLGCCSFSGELD